MPLLKEGLDLKEKKVALEDFDKLPRDEKHHYEFVDDMVLMTPKSTLLHQMILTNLSAELRFYFKGKPCKVFSEAEVKLKKDIFIPDISILCDSTKFNKPRYEGPPTITIEILSPGTIRYDLFTKLNKYQLGGVQEYWIVDPKSQSVTVHHFETEAADIFTADEMLTTPLFDDLSIDLMTIFE